MENKIVKITSQQIQGTWDGARHWLDAARRFQQCTLWAQVMLGFELIAIRDSIPTRQGKRKDLKDNDLTSCQNGTKFDEVIEKELGLSVRTAYRFMEMAHGLQPRLKKIQGLDSIDIEGTPISKMPEEVQEALSNAVRKATDGKSQMDFCLDLGIYKVPQGSGATGRQKGAQKTDDEEAHPTKPTLSEQADIFLQVARADWEQVALGLDGYCDKFTVLTDMEVTAQISQLEQLLKARKAWLEQPVGSRDVDPIKKILLER